MDKVDIIDIIQELARLFRAADHELYVVGGAVRDMLLQRPTAPDFDLTTDARPDEIKRLVAATHPAAVVTVGEQFGTIRVHYAGQASEARDDMRAELGGFGPSPAPVVAETPVGVEVVEITTYRSDRYNPESRKPEVTFGDTLEGDLLRRDFTINAMARDPLSGAIADPYGGRADLERRLIRAVGDAPEHRFDEDPLRMLRACRFAAQLEFDIERSTAEAIRRSAGLLAKISRERIRDEFTKLLVSPNPARGLRLTVNFGLMPHIVPEALELRGVSQAPAHSKDVYEHVLRVVARTPPRPATRWAGLLHDIAKPRTRSVENGAVHFFGHEDVGATMARDILRRLKFDRPFIDHVARLVKLHMRANAYTPDWTDGAVRRLMLEADSALQDLLDLSRADITSYRPEKVSRAEARVDDLATRCQWLREEAERVPLKSPLDGLELMELFARPPGPWIRPIKDYLLDLVIDGQLAPDDKATAIVLARRKMVELEAGGGEGAAAATPTADRPVSPPAPQPPSATAPALASASTSIAKAERRAAAKRKSREAFPDQGGAPTEAS
jgi:poly(A) polymerase